MAQDSKSYTLPPDLKFNMPSARAEPLPSGGRTGGKPVPVTADQRPVPCPEYGTGYVRYPGAATCVRLSGRVSAEVQTQSRRNLYGDSSGTRVTSSAAIETRTPTEFGTIGVTVIGRGTRATGTAGSEPWR